MTEGKRPRMGRWAVPLVGIAVLVGLLSGCIFDERVDGDEVGAACFEKGGAVVDVQTQDTYPKKRSERKIIVNDSAAREDKTVRLILRGHTSDNLSRRISIGDEGVSMRGDGDRGTIQIHVLLSITDVALHEEESPHLYVNVTSALDSGTYTIRACFQEVQGFSGKEVDRAYEEAMVELSQGHGW